MRILITGGAGTLGAGLTERYLERGDNVLIIDNFATGFRGALPETHPNMTLVEGSIVDRKLVDEAFAGFRPTHVIHSAASYKDPDDWLEDARTNVEGTIHVIEASRAAGVERIVNFHTALGYGRPETVPIPVDAPARPFTSYGISKQAGENYLADAVRLAPPRQRYRSAAGDRANPDLLHALEGRQGLLLFQDRARLRRHG